MSDLPARLRTHANTWIQEGWRTAAALVREAAEALEQAEADNEDRKNIEEDNKHLRALLMSLTYGDIDASDVRAELKQMDNKERR